MNDEAIGALGAQSSVRRCRIDDVTLTYVVDGAMAMVPEVFFPAIPQEYWAEHPEGLDAQRRVPMSAGGLLVERGSHRLLIDAGLGSIVGSIVAEPPLGQANSGAFIECLDGLGVAASDIDVLALTHLHPDHTGWMFSRTNSGPSEPTFPNATYVVSEAEWVSLTHGGQSSDMTDHHTIVEPLSRHRRLSLIGDGSEVSPGVTAVVTPGHSAGHASYVVKTSAGQRLVAFGDIFHVPAQLSHPTWGSAPDYDSDAVPKARMRIISELLQPHSFGFGTHFGDQPFGRVVQTDGSLLRWEAMATEVLAPPPRSL